MADYISQVTLPNNQTYYLSIPYVVGTGTAAGTWTGDLSGLEAYYDGLTILYKTPVAGASTTTLNLNGLGAKTCYLNSTTKLTTHYPINQPFILIYAENLNSGCWIASDYTTGDTRDAGYGKLAIQAASLSTDALTANTATVAAYTYNETLKVYAGNKWIALAGTNSSSNNADEFKIGHTLSSVTAGTSSPNSAQAPGYGATFNIPTITVDAAGHVTAMGTTTVQIPSSDNVDEKVKQTPITATASAEYNILLKNSTGNSEETAAVKFANNTNKQVTINPSTGKITAPGGLEGTASRATADASGNTITTTYAPLNSPSLTGTPLAPTAPNGTSTTQIATTEFVNNTLSYANAMVFKGTLGTGGTTATLPTTHEAGWTYKVVTSGTYAGMVCQEGDLVICINDRNTANNDDWTSVQVNDDGLVTGPASVTSGHIAVFDGTSGRIIKSGGTTIANATVNKANEWVNARKVYVALNTADKTVTINGSSSSAAAAIALGVDGQLNVANGGTGASSFTSGELLIGNGTSAVGTRAIYNRTTINALSATATWSNSTAIPTLNTLRYWDGRYQTTNNASALAYCNKGAFGSIVTANATDYVLRNGDTMLGTLTVKGLKGTENVDYGTTLPQSSTSGQIFFQISEPQYEIPSGGTTGQALIKNSNNDRDVGWGAVGGIMTPTTTTKYYVSGSSSTTANTDPALFDPAVYVEDSVLFGAAWNDYAEYRQCTQQIEPGRCIIENGDGTLSLSTKRLQGGAEIVSDTFGFAIGQTSKCNTPIAVSGRVLAYINEPHNTLRIGAPVCSGPNGTVSQMTDDEARTYPWLIIGTISSIPQEEKWGEHNININNRIWIRVR